MAQMSHSQTQTYVTQSIVRDPELIIIAGDCQGPIYTGIIDILTSTRDIRVVSFDSIDESIDYAKKQRETLLIATDDTFWPDCENAVQDVMVVSMSLLLSILEDNGSLNLTTSRQYSQQLNGSSITVIAPAALDTISKRIINECGGKVVEASYCNNVLLVPGFRPTVKVLELVARHSRKIIGKSFWATVKHPHNKFYNGDIGNYRENDILGSILSFRFNVPVDEDYFKLPLATRTLECVKSGKHFQNTIILIDNVASLGNTDIVAIRDNGLIVLRLGYLLDTIRINSYQMPEFYIIRGPFFKNPLDTIQELRVSIKIDNPDNYNIALKCVHVLVGEKVYTEEESDLVVTDSITNIQGRQTITVYGLRELMETCVNKQEYYHTPIADSIKLRQCFRNKSILNRGIVNSYEFDFWSAVLQISGGCFVKSPPQSSRNFYVCGKMDDGPEILCTFNELKMMLINVDFLCNVVKTGQWVDPIEADFTQQQAASSQKSLMWYPVPSFIEPSTESVGFSHLDLHRLVNCFTNSGFVETSEICNNSNESFEADEPTFRICVGSSVNVIIGITHSLSDCFAVMDNICKYLKNLGIRSFRGTTTGNEILMAVVLEDGIIPVCRIPQSDRNTRQICLLSKIAKTFNQQLPKVFTVICRQNLLACRSCQHLLATKFINFVLPTNKTRETSGYNIIHNNTEYTILLENDVLGCFGESIVEKQASIFELIQRIIRRNFDYSPLTKQYCSDTCIPVGEIISFSDLHNIERNTCAKCERTIRNDILFLASRKN